MAFDAPRHQSRRLHPQRRSLEDRLQLYRHRDRISQDVPCPGSTRRYQRRQVNGLYLSPAGRGHSQEGRHARPTYRSSRRPSSSGRRFRQLRPGYYGAKRDQRSASRTDGGNRDAGSARNGNELDKGNATAPARSTLSTTSTKSTSRIEFYFFAHLTAVCVSFPQSKARKRSPST